MSSMGSAVAGLFLNNVYNITILSYIQAGICVFVTIYYELYLKKSINRQNAERENESTESGNISSGSDSDLDPISDFDKEPELI